MSSDHILDKVKKLRELTGVGFKDCKSAIDETKGDIEKLKNYCEKDVKSLINFVQKIK